MIKGNDNSKDEECIIQNQANDVSFKQSFKFKTVSVLCATDDAKLFSVKNKLKATIVYCLS